MSTVTLLTTNSTLFNAKIKGTKWGKFVGGDVIPPMVPMLKLITRSLIKQLRSFISKIKYEPNAGFDVDGMMTISLFKLFGVAIDD